MPNFKKEGRGFKMKGFTPFTKLVGKVSKRKKSSPSNEEIYPKMRKEVTRRTIKREYEPQSTNPRREYVPQTQRGKKKLSKKLTIGFKEAMAEGLAEAAASGAMMGGVVAKQIPRLAKTSKVKKKSPMKKATDPTKKKPTAKVKSNKMQEANAEERAIMKQQDALHAKMKNLDKDSKEYKDLMNKSRDLDNKLWSYD
jgi:hypothetical protein|tara:strand:- start:535 stop:1125 length:591 start_codon:yes stop_codon:yes gene_type:complete